MRSIYLILFLMVSYTAFAQQDTTSVFKEKLTKADSSSLRINNKIDSIQGKVNSLVNPDLNQLAKKSLDKKKTRHDSISFYKKRDKEKKKVLSKRDAAIKNNEPTEIYLSQLDSLDKLKYNPHLSSSSGSKQKELGNLKQNATHPFDSLKAINPSLPSSKLTSKIDSLEQVGPMKQISNAESTVNQTEQKLNAPVNKVEGTVNEKLALMNKEGGAKSNIPSGASIPDADVKTNLNLPKAEVKLDNPLGEVNNPLNEQLGGVGEVKDKISEVKSIPQEQIGKVKSINEVKGVQDKMGTANKITDKAQAYSGDVKNIADGNLSEVKEAPKALEGKAAELGGVKDLQKEAGAFDQYKDIAGKGNDPEAMKQLALKKAQQSFKAPTNHFAGQEEVLKKAMDNMSKLKEKYSSLDSLKDIPKRRPNEMKGKPFIERLLPGITVQVQKNNNVLIDYNPYLGYRISGKLTAGAGWNERFSIGKHVHFSLKDRIYGPRVFVDFKVWKGFSVRTDIEKMNTYIPSIATSGRSGDPSHRAWVWSAFIGLKKEYKFWGSVKGNAQFLYNLYDDHNNSPYGDRVVVRMGFEFPIKKKKPD